MSTAIEVKKLSHTHEQILNWLVCNPQLSMRECADHFGYTQSWLSSLVRSDIFQAALKERQNQVAVRVAQSIPERLHAIAQIATDKLATMAEASEDPEFILDVADKVLHRMGYAPVSARNPGGISAGVPGNGVGIVQQNNVTIMAGDLAEARAIMSQVGAQGLERLQAAPAPAGLAPIEGELVSPNASE